MRFNARQVREAKQKAVKDAKDHRRLGGRFMLASGMVTGVVTGLWLSYVAPDVTKVWGDQISAFVRSVRE